MGNTDNSSIKLDQCIASYLLTLNLGDQIQSIRKLGGTYGASLGSISALLTDFEDKGAVKISHRGHLGSFLEAKSIGKLWNIIRDRPLVIGLTLPSFLKCEGLATAIYLLLNNAGIEAYTTFIRGSVNRMSALRNGVCHAVVMSKLSADELCGPEEEVLIQLPRESFTREHRVFYRANKDNSSIPLKVGVDLDSLDIRFMTEAEFADRDVEFCNMAFTQIDLHLEDSPIDIAITNSDFMDRLISKGFTSRQLSNRVLEIIGDRANSATFVVKKCPVATRIVLKEILIPDKILAIQREVVEGRMLPRY